MGKRNLPIKIINKRVEVDERKPEPGFGGNIPSFVLKDDKLKQKALSLKGKLNETREEANNKFEKYKSLPIVIKAKVNDDALAKSYRKELIELITNSKSDNVFGMSEEQELLIRIDEIKELDTISNNLEAFAENAIAISGIDSIKVSNPQMVLKEDVQQAEEKLTYKIKLMDFNNKYINVQVENVFYNILEAKKVKFDKVRYSENLYVYKVVCDSLETFDELSDFSPLQSIVPMPKITVVTDSFFEESFFKIPEFKKDENYPIVGILDSGVDNLTQLGPWLSEEKFSSYPQEYINSGHGTFVGGIIAFADILEGRVHTGLNGCKLFDATVFPDKSKEEILEADLINNVREAIEMHGEKIKIWNMSLGVLEECPINDFSDFGMSLDNIQSENNVLIIKSAGNCKNFSINKPVSRIARGADSIKAVTVGAIAHDKSAGDIADINHISPFSRIGPGPASIIKPELVHYGGNAGVVNGKLCKTGVNSLNRRGMVAKNVGTSF